MRLPVTGPSSFLSSDEYLNDRERICPARREGKRRKKADDAVQKDVFMLEGTKSHPNPMHIVPFSVNKSKCCDGEKSDD